ncbi:MAG: ABC transporter permease [Nanoarchaeota archaeon]|nr:ABC transporter permease [Nanoarchaeota archaeon]
MSLRTFLELSYQMGVAEFHAKNEGSYLGIFWYLLSPLLMFLSLWLIFFDRIGQSIPSYPGYLLLGIVLFSFFQDITTKSIRLMRNQYQLITSINFNKATLVLSAVITQLLSHFFELFLLVIIFSIFGISPVGLLLYLPLIFLFAAFTYGFSLLLVSLGSYFKDLDNIWVFFTRLLWFVTPIFYSFEGQKRLFILNQFNPVYHFISVAREMTLYAHLPLLSVLLIIILTIISIVIGTLLFNRSKYRFAEVA